MQFCARVYVCVCILIVFMRERGLFDVCQPKEMSIMIICKFLVCQPLNLFPIQKEFIILLVKDKAYLQL